MYEGYGPQRVAVLIECLTDNRNRAAGEVRVAMSRNGGSMADPGSVSYLFARKGVVLVPADGLTEDDILLAVLDAGAEEVNDLDGTFEVICEPTDPWLCGLHCRMPALTTTPPRRLSSPAATVPLEAEGAAKIFRLLEALDDSDDVQNVYANFDVSDEVMAQVNS